VFAKEIARLLRCNVESAFLCGLLHAIGKPALLQVVADVEQALERACLASERTRTGAGRVSVPALVHELHVGVGRRIADRWALPRPVVNAIATYGSYDHAAGATLEAMLTCLADRLATDLTEPGHFDDESLRAHAVFSHLNLYPDDVARLLGKRAEIAAIVESLTV
jgi:HD-like signal output (HDOD) protein